MHLGIVIDDLDAGNSQADAAGLAMIQAGGDHGLDRDGGFAYLGTEEISRLSSGADDTDETPPGIPRARTHLSQVFELGHQTLRSA